jgi:hypothetical protein
LRNRWGMGHVACDTQQHTTYTAYTHTRPINVFCLFLLLLEIISGSLWNKLVYIKYRERARAREREREDDQKSNGRMIKATNASSTTRDTNQTRCHRHYKLNFVGTMSVN